MKQKQSKNKPKKNLTNSSKIDTKSKNKQEEKLK